MNYQRESLDQVRAEVEPLLYAHWQEISSYPDIPLDPDWSIYERAQELNRLRFFTARAERVLAGYAVYFLGHNPHYRGSLQARQDILYLSPEYRRGGAGLRLVRYADEQLAEEGVQVVYQHVKLAHPALGRLLERVGYEPVETLYARRLDE